MRQANKGHIASASFPAEDAAALPGRQGNKVGKSLPCGQAAQLDGDQHCPVWQVDS